MSGTRIMDVGWVAADSIAKAGLVASASCRLSRAHPAWPVVAGRPMTTAGTAALQKSEAETDEELADETFHPDAAGDSI
jgi:hypothetical protein